MKMLGKQIRRLTRNEDGQGNRQVRAAGTHFKGASGFFYLLPQFSAKLMA